MVDTGRPSDLLGPPFKLTVLISLSLCVSVFSKTVPQNKKFTTSPNLYNYSSTSKLSVQNKVSALDSPSFFSVSRETRDPNHCTVHRSGVNEVYKILNTKVKQVLSGQRSKQGQRNHFATRLGIRLPFPLCLRFLPLSCFQSWSCLDLCGVARLRQSVICFINHKRI